MAKPDAPEFPSMSEVSQGEGFGTTKKIIKTLMTIDLKLDEAKASSPIVSGMCVMESNGAHLKATVGREIDSNQLLVASGFARGGVEALGLKRETAAWQAQFSQQVEPLKSDAVERTKQQKEFFELVVNWLGRLHDKFSDLVDKLGGDIRNNDVADLTKLKKDFAELTTMHTKLNINIQDLQSKLDSVNRQLDALMPERKAEREEKRPEPTAPQMKT